MKDQKKTYFPQGLAQNIAFCNRKLEKEQLCASIEAHEHVVLMAPRRYGKTSLLAKVLQDNAFYGASIDLFFAFNEHDVLKMLRQGVSELMKQLLPKTKAACHEALSFLQKVHPKISFQFLGGALDISMQTKQEEGIRELLMALNALAKKYKKTCVLVLDEFQQVAALKKAHAVEAMIRHAVERSEYVSYIFCGSHRHLLNAMFSDKGRPLYHLCDLMTIDRIETKHYKPFINKAAKSRWGAEMSEDVLMDIIGLCENHPYYVNGLCRHLFRKNALPDRAAVMTTWKNYVGLQAPWIINELAMLTLSQRRVLQVLAEAATSEPNGQSFIMATQLGASTISKCINKLESTDWIFKNADGEYHVLDPAILYYLREKAA